MRWQETSRRTVYENYGRGLVEATFLLPTGATETFLLRTDRPCVAVFGLTETNEVILTRQFRPGPGRVVFEMPGGYVDPDESPLDAATREFLEETGFSGDIAIVGQCYADSYSSAIKYCAVATSCVRTAHPADDDAGLVAVRLTTMAEFRRILRSGDLIDVDLAYVALDHLGLLAESAASMLDAKPKRTTETG